MKFATGFLMLLVFTGAGHSQELTRRLDEAQRLNWYVKIVAVDSTSISGRIRRTDSEVIVVGSQKILVTDVASLERRLSVGGGWKAGAVAGVLVGSMFGAGLAGLCDSNCDGLALQGALIFGGVGAILIGTMGQVVSPGRHRWVRIWP